MSDKEKIKVKVKQKINHLITDLKMLENGLSVVNTKENSNLWLSHIRTDIGNLQTLTNQYHECNN